MIRLVVLLLALLPAAAEASSPAAWSAYEKAARAACARASGLAAPVTSSIVTFSDASAKSAILVEGHWPQAHMKGRRGTMLCLYDRRTKRAEAMEAAGWQAR